MRYEPLTAPRKKLNVETLRRQREFVWETFVFWHHQSALRDMHDTGGLKVPYNLPVQQMFRIGGRSPGHILSFRTIEGSFL